MKRQPRLWLGLAAIVIVAPMAYAIAGLLASEGGGPAASGPIYGLRLGVSPSDTRRLFDPGVDGVFRASSFGEGLALEWEPSQPQARVRAARFEFHGGLLVAVRLTLPAGASNEEELGVSASASAVLSRSRVDGEERWIWIARSCPTHAGEARALLGD